MKVQQMRSEQEAWQSGKGYSDTHEYGGINRPSPSPQPPQKPKQVVVEGGAVSSSINGKRGSAVTLIEVSQEAPTGGEGGRDKGKQREGSTGTASTEDTVREGRRESQSRERSASLGGVGGAAAATEAYEPVAAYDRGAYVETSRVGLQ